MTKRFQDVSAKRGDTVELEVPITDENGDPFDLTDVAEVKWALFDYVDGSGFVEQFRKLLSLGEITLIQINGTGAVLDGLKIDIEPADTTGLEPGNYTHECEVTEAGGGVFTPFEGRWHLGRDKITT